MGLDDAVPFGFELRPTEKEFKNFKSYVYSIMDDPKYRAAGCVKVSSVDNPPKVVPVRPLYLRGGAQQPHGLQAD